MENKGKFESALYVVAPRIRDILKKLPAVVTQNAEAIRLRCELPVALTVGGETVFVLENGQISFSVTNNVLTAKKEDIDESFKLLCKSSVYAHSEELKNGFIMMNGGHRAGVCGTLLSGGTMNNVSSLNIRIAREIFGAANDIARRYKGGGLLIAGPPGSGKTTVLRDLIRQLSDGLCGKTYRVAVIDSRGEISGSSGGKTENDLGANSDVLLTADKALGLEIAVRTMFPDIAVFDEIGTQAELVRVRESFCAGVSVITTAHIGSAADILKREVTASLVKSGAISEIAVLPQLHGGTIRFINTKELISGVAV